MKYIEDLIVDKEFLIRRVLHTHFIPKYICAKYRIELDDLMQVGRIAIWEASKKFRAKENGTSFDTYAHQVIRYRLLDYLRFLDRPIRQLDYCLSLHAEIAGDMEVIDIIPCQENIDDEILEQSYFEAITSQLSTHEKKILQQRLLGYSYNEIEKILSIKEFVKVKENMMEKIKNDRLQTAAN